MKEIVFNIPDVPQTAISFSVTLEPVAFMDTQAQEHRRIERERKEKAEEAKQARLKIKYGCSHDKSEHFADGSSSSSGRIDWCPNCGAIAINNQWVYPKSRTAVTP